MGGVQYWNTSWRRASSQDRMSSSSLVVRPSEAGGENYGRIQLDTHVKERKRFLAPKLATMDDKLLSPITTEFLVQVFPVVLNFHFSVCLLIYIS